MSGIEKGIPAQGVTGSRRRAFGLRDTLREMKVGDSVLFSETSRAAVSNACGWVALEMKAAFTTRVVDGGTRVWRLR